MPLPPTIAAAAAAAVRVARSQGDRSCVALVGSWATGTATPESDVDLVVLVERPERLLGTSDWHEEFGQGARLIRERDFGAVQERRLQLGDDLVVEVAVGDLAWASTTPLDEGTRTVALGGLVVLHDPEHRLDQLLRAVRSGSTVGP